MNNAQRKSKFASNISLNVWAEETSPTPNISQVSKFASSQSLNKWSDGSVRSVPVTNLKPDTGKLKNMYGFNIQNMNQAPDGLMSEKERSGSTVAILNDTSSDKVTQQAKDLTFVDCVECFDNMCTIL